MEFLPLIFIILIALVVYTIIHSNRTERKLHDLEWRMIHIEKLADKVKKIEAEWEILLGEKHLDVQPRKSPSHQNDSIPTTADEQIHEPSISTSVKNIPKVLPSTDIDKSRTREEWESFIGGRLLNRIGALALIIGLGFFLKYAFDNEWLSETVRVLIGVCVGIVCLVLAYVTRKRGYSIFAQGLVGAGIAILYLSVYASFNFYSLIPQWTAFFCMSLITAGSLVLGLTFGSLAIGILGWAGGFLTPLMLSTGTANEIGLFTYLALLNVGLLAIVFAKSEWQIIEPLALIGTWILYFTWYFKYYNESDLLVTVFFISLFWILFCGLDIARLRYWKPGHTIIHDSVAVLNVLLYFIILYSLVEANHHPWMGGVTLLLGILYFLFFLWIKRSRELTDIEIKRFHLISMILLVLATSIQFENFTTVQLWSLEAVALFWMGLWGKRRFIYLAATALLVIASMKFIVTDGAFAFSEIAQFTFLLNERCLTLIVLSGSFGVCALLSKRTDRQREILSQVFHPAWCIALFVLITVEINDFFRYGMHAQTPDVIARLSFMRILLLAPAWGLLALPLTWFALKKRNSPVLVPALIILAFSICSIAVRGFAYEPISDFQLIFNIRTAAVLINCFLLFLHLHIMRNTIVPIWLPSVITGIQISLVILPLVLFSGETIDYFEQLINSSLNVQQVIDRLYNLRQLTLSVVWLLYSVVLMVIGFWRSVRTIRILAFVLFGITILKIFIYDLSYLETLYRIVSFVGLGIILMTVSFIYQRYKYIILGSDDGTRNEIHTQ